MRAGKLSRTGVLAGVWLILVTCTSEPQPAGTKITTYDILLDYDQENNTHIAGVYKGAMERFDEYDMSQDRMKERTDTVNGHVVHVFGIKHESRKAIIRFLRNVLPFIINPEEWVFLVEGCEEENPILPELYFFTGVAKELEIKTIDPIVSPLGEEVTERLTSGTHPLVNVKDIHFALFNNVFPDQQSLHRLSERSRNRYVKVISSYSLQPEDTLKNWLEEYDTTYLAHPLNLAAARRVFAQIRRDMIDTANVLSNRKFQKLLPEVKGSEHIFICVGYYHLPVFDDLETKFETLYEIHSLPEEESSNP